MSILTLLQRHGSRRFSQLLKTGERQVKCTECHKDMVAQFTREGGKLEGWTCDCRNSEKAILRERQFTKEMYYGDKAHQR